MNNGDDLRGTINLNGEFLGISSLAIFSAPVYLRLVLLILIGVMFFYRTRADSLAVRRSLEGLAASEKDEPDLLQQFNRFFFGFTVSRRNQSAYWIGFMIFLITLADSIFVSVRALVAGFL